EQRVVLRQRGDERRSDREVVLFAVAGAAGASVAVERLVEEDLPALLDQRLLRIALRRLARDQNQRRDRGHDQQRRDGAYREDADRPGRAEPPRPFLDLMATSEHSGASLVRVSCHWMTPGSRFRFEM